MQSPLIGKPVLIDKLDPGLGARISAWIAEDTRQAQARKREREEKKRARKRGKR